MYHHLQVERILEVHHKKNGAREFLIHWKGWASQFDSWEPESNLNCPELIKKFMDKVNKLIHNLKMYYSNYLLDFNNNTNNSSFKFLYMLINRWKWRDHRNQEI